MEILRLNPKAKFYGFYAIEKNMYKAAENTSAAGAFSNIEFSLAGRGCQSRKL